MFTVALSIRTEVYTTLHTITDGGLNTRAAHTLLNKMESKNKNGGWRDDSQLEGGDHGFSCLWGSGERPRAVVVLWLGSSVCRLQL